MTEMLRAVDADDRQVRRQSILDSARVLFRQGDGRLPTAAEVATAAGLAKGTVYIYFKTKEEIFANVLLEGWLPLLASTEAIFLGHKKKGRFKQAQVFINATVRHLAEVPELLRLDALGASVLEKNMTSEALLEYKRRFNEALFDAGDRIDKALSLTPGRGVQLLLRTYALTRGLWQTAEHFEELEEVCSDLVSSWHRRPFSQDLCEALEEYWRGALA
jgi:TetR/AcrR family transcriptional regulator